MAHCFTILCKRWQSSMSLKLENWSLHIKRFGTTEFGHILYTLYSGTNLSPNKTNLSPNRFTVTKARKPSPTLASPSQQWRTLGVISAGSAGGSSVNRLSKNRKRVIARVKNPNLGMPPLSMVDVWLVWRFRVINLRT